MASKSESVRSSAVTADASDLAELYPNMPTTSGDDDDKLKNSDEHTNGSSSESSTSSMCKLKSNSPPKKKPAVQENAALRESTLSRSPLRRRRLGDNDRIPESTSAPPGSVIQAVNSQRRNDPDSKSQFSRVSETALAAKPKSSRLVKEDSRTTAATPKPLKVQDYMFKPRAFLCAFAVASVLCILTIPRISRLLLPTNDQQEPPVPQKVLDSGKLYNEIMQISKSSDVVWNNQLSEIAAQIVEQLFWLARKEQPPLPVVFVTVPDDDLGAADFQRCIIEKILNAIRLNLNSEKAMASQSLSFANLSTLQNGSTVSQTFDYQLASLGNVLKDPYKNFGLKVIIGEGLDMLPASSISHLAPLFELLSGDVPDRRSMWAFTLRNVPPGILDLYRENNVDADVAVKSIRRSMENYLRSRWLNGPYNGEQLTALFARLTSTILIPTAIAGPMCSRHSVLPRIN